MPFVIFILSKRHISNKKAEHDETFLYIYLIAEPDMTLHDAEPC